jgi:hypothetical protein
VDRRNLVAASAAPEIEAARLRDRLAEIEAEHATLEAELAAFNADYMRAVVTVLAQLQEVEARILGLAARRSHSRDDARLARQARARARETTAHIKAVPQPAGPLPTTDLKRLFREAAKRMHPDLAPDDATRGHAEAFMKRLNQAYKKGDAEAIQDLVRQWEASPAVLAAADDATRAARQLEALHAAVLRAQRRLDETRASELAELMERAMTAAAAGTDLLADMRAAAEAALADARARLAELQG